MLRITSAQSKPPDRREKYDFWYTFKLLYFHVKGLKIPSPTSFMYITQTTRVLPAQNKCGYLVRNIIMSLHEATAQCGIKHIFLWQYGYSKLHLNIILVIASRFI